MDFLPLRSLCLLNRLEKREFLPCLFVPLCLCVSLPLVDDWIVGLSGTSLPLARQLMGSGCGGNERDDLFTGDR